MSKTYILYLKSHDITPDFQVETEAESQTEALRKFRKQYKKELIDFEDDYLLDNIGIVK